MKFKNLPTFLVTSSNHLFYPSPTANAVVQALSSYHLNYYRKFSSGFPDSNELLPPFILHTPTTMTFLRKNLLI